MKIFSKGNKKRAGFTLVELMIVVIVVGILAAASIPIYQRSMDKARASEGKALLGTIRTHYITEVAAENVPTVPPTSLTVDWGIDTSRNRWWTVEGVADDFTIAWALPTVTIAGVAATKIYNIELRINCDTGELEENFNWPGTPLPAP
ncbi:hypothetical protein CEE34_03600 [Candidatus Aerophobetes bacterium Ae_b3a]|nr:MAG: hypothetical protein CEE34_03600 [Candidatus Aerophobetes bacterium Ae_b3a]